MATATIRPEQVAKALGGELQIKRLVEGYRQNVRAYSAQLPELLEKHRHEWVAFDNGERLVVAPSREDVMAHLSSHSKISRAVIVRFIDDPGKAHYH